MSGSRRKPGPLGPLVEGYRAWLLGRGYVSPVVIRSLVTLGHLGRWLEREQLAVDQLTDDVVGRFLAEYRRDRGRLPAGSVWPLVEYLRAAGAVAPEPPAALGPVEQLLGKSRTLPRGIGGAATASGCLASAGWRRSRSAAASDSLADF
jgi:hypothetical protein